MHKYDDPTAVAVMPAVPAAGTAGFFFDGDLQTGIPATILRAWFLNMMQAELVNLVQGAGITPSRTNYDQVLSAVQMLGGVFGVAAGTANALTIVPLTPVELYAAGLDVTVLVGTANTAAATLNVSGLGARAIINPDGSALSAGELQPSSMARLTYNGTAFVFANAPVSPTPAVGDASARNATTGWTAALVAAVAGSAGRNAATRMFNFRNFR